MKNIFAKKAALSATALCCVISAPSAYAQGWTLEKIDLQGSSSTNEFGQTFNGEFSSLQGLAEDWDNYPTWHQDGQVSVHIESGVEQGTNTDPREINLDRANGNLIARIKGPAGCAGQTQTVCFFTTAYASSQVQVATGNPEPHGGFAEILVKIGDNSVPASSTRDNPPGGPTPPNYLSRKVLFQAEVTYDLDEKAEVTIPFSITGKASHHYPPQPNGVASYDILAEAQGGFYINPDTRSVHLTRNNKDRFELENGVWVTYGDTTYSFLRHAPGAPGFPSSTLVPNQVAIKANYSGGWIGFNGNRYHGDGILNASALDVTYAWNPSLPNELDAFGNGEDVTTHRQTMPQGGLGFYTGGGDPIIGLWKGANIAPTPLSIEYSAQDNGDNVVAKAKYKLTVHDPIELIKTDRFLVSYSTDYFTPEGTTLKVNYPNVPGGTYEVTTSQSSGWSLTGTIGGELEKFQIPIGVEIGYQWTHEKGFTQVAPTPKDADGNEIKPGPGEFMYLRIKHSYNRHHSYFWKYNQEGKERRWYTPGNGQIDPGVPIEPMEVPHEAIWDVFSGDTLDWSAPRSTTLGAPQPGDPQETLPGPSFKYSQREKSKHAKSVG